jgi:hypothetical protein
VIVDDLPTVFEFAEYEREFAVRVIAGPGE